MDPHDLKSVEFRKPAAPSEVRADSFRIPPHILIAMQAICFICLLWLIGDFVKAAGGFRLPMAIVLVTSAIGMWEGSFRRVFTAYFMFSALPIVLLVLYITVFPPY
jgi:hypothetical protein